MEKLNSEGLARAIGLSNFYPDRFVDLIEHNEIAPAISQVECHPFFQRADSQALMRERGAQIESWGPFAEGRNNLFSDLTLSEIGAAHGKSVARGYIRRRPAGRGLLPKTSDLQAMPRVRAQQQGVPPA